MRWRTAAKTVAKSECRWFAPAEANEGNICEQQVSMIGYGASPASRIVVIAITTSVVVSGNLKHSNLG
jgi:hypothetical protein